MAVIVAACGAGSSRAVPQRDAGPDAGRLACASLTPCPVAPDSVLGPDSGLPGCALTLDQALCGLPFAGTQVVACGTSTVIDTPGPLGTSWTYVYDTSSGALTALLEYDDLQGYAACYAGRGGYDGGPEGPCPDGGTSVSASCPAGDGGS